MSALRRLLPLLLVLFVALPAQAVEPDEMLADPALEARARALSEEIRCLVCQNESIDSSNADLARDLRLLVRERIAAGDSDQEVKDFLVARYGDFVLLRPPVKPATWPLWFGPLAILLLGALLLAIQLRRRRQPAVEPPALSPDEERRLAALLDERDERP